MKDFFEFREAYRKPTAAEIAADKAKDRKGKDTSDRYRNMKKKVYGNMMGGLKKEETELTESPDLMKMSKELLKHKSKGVNYEKAAAYVRAIHNNSNVNVQDKAMKGLLDLLKNMDLTDRTTITKILKDNGFKVRGGRLMRESVELDEISTSLLKRARDKASKNTVDARNSATKNTKKHLKDPEGGHGINALKDYDKADKSRRQKKHFDKSLKKRGVKESVELDEAVAKIKTTMPDKVASGAQRFGLKATTKGGHVSISGSKGKLNDFMRAIIGRSSYGNASDVTESVDLTEKNTIDIAREIVKTKGAKHGLDMQSANLILKVYDKVNDKNKKKMETMSPSALGKAVWKIYAKMQGK